MIFKVSLWPKFLLSPACAQIRKGSESLYLLFCSKLDNGKIPLRLQWQLSESTFIAINLRMIAWIWSNGGVSFMFLYLCFGYNLASAYCKDDIVAKTEWYRLRRMNHYSILHENTFNLYSNYGSPPPSTCRFFHLHFHLNPHHLFLSY